MSPAPVLPRGEGGQTPSPPGCRAPGRCPATTITNVCMCVYTYIYMYDYCYIITVILLLLTCFHGIINIACYILLVVLLLLLLLFEY